MWSYISDQESLNNIVPTIMSNNEWGYDTETTGLDPIKDRVTLIQIGNEEQQFIIDSRKVNPEPLRPFFEGKDHFLYGHNLKFDYKMMKTSFGIECERLRCTYLGEKILTCGLKFNGFGLDDVMGIHLGIAMDKELQKSFIGHTGEFSQAQLEYAANDVKYLLPLKRALVNKLKRDGLGDTFFLECEAIPVFGDMEVHGLKLNRERWTAIAKNNLYGAEKIAGELDEMARLLDYETDMFGEVRIDWSSPLQVVKFLQKMGVKVKDRDSSGNTIERLIDKSDDKTLKKAKDCEAVKLIKQFRSAMVRVNTFGKPFIDAIHPISGRIHPDFEQIGTETGRIAAGHSPVNMLNIPRDKDMRNCFIAEDDYVMETHDYSGCELRIWAHLSQDPELCKALRNHIDLHCHVATKLYGVEVKKGNENYRLRTPCKSLNFGIAYGMGPTALYWQINGQNFPISMQEARDLFNKYCNEFKTGVEFLRKKGEEALNNKYLSNLNGRRRNWIIPDPSDLTKFPRGAEDRSYIGIIEGIKREGGNHQIQSVNADITKYAMTRLRDHIKKNKVRSCVVLQVYDEIVTHTHKDDSEQFVHDKERIMIEAASRWVNSVPIEVEGNVLPYWTK